MNIPETAAGPSTGNGPEAHPATGSPRHGRRRWPLTVFAAVVIVVVGTVIAVVVASRPDPVTHTIAIPAGTADRIARGQPIQLIPDVLRLRRDDRMIITNGDSVTHTLGPYSVRAGERLEIRYSRSGVFPGPCTFVTKGRTVIVVT